MVFINASQGSIKITGSVREDGGGDHNTTSLQTKDGERARLQRQKKNVHKLQEGEKTYKGKNRKRDKGNQGQTKNTDNEI